MTLPESSISTELWREVLSLVAAYLNITITIIIVNNFGNIIINIIINKVDIKSYVGILHIIISICLKCYTVLGWLMADKVNPRVQLMAPIIHLISQKITRLCACKCSQRVL